MSSERITGRTRTDQPTDRYPVAIPPGSDDLEGYDLRDTVNDIVVRGATFAAFHAALASFRGRLHRNVGMTSPIPGPSLH